jgi:hypothetical protein
MDDIEKSSNDSRKQSHATQPFLVAKEMEDFIWYETNKSTLHPIVWLPKCMNVWLLFIPLLMAMVGLRA